MNPFEFRIILALVVLIGVVILAAQWALIRMQRQIRSLEAQCDAHLALLKDRAAYVTRLQAELAELERQYAVQTEVIAEMEDKNAALKAEKEKLMHELAGMQVHRDDSDDRIGNGGLSDGRAVTWGLAVREHHFEELTDDN